MNSNKIAMIACCVIILYSITLSESLPRENRSFRRNFKEEYDNDITVEEIPLDENYDLFDQDLNYKNPESKYDDSSKLGFFLDKAINIDDFTNFSGGESNNPFNHEQELPLDSNGDDSKMSTENNPWGPEPIEKFNSDQEITLAKVVQAFRENWAQILRDSPIFKEPVSLDNFTVSVSCKYYGPSFQPEGNESCRQNITIHGVSLSGVENMNSSDISANIFTLNEKNDPDVCPIVSGSNSIFTSKNNLFEIYATEPLNLTFTSYEAGHYHTQGPFTCDLSLTYLPQVLCCVSICKNGGTKVLTKLAMDEYDEKNLRLSFDCSPMLFSTNSEQERTLQKLMIFEIGQFFSKSIIKEINSFFEKYLENAYRENFNIVNPLPTRCEVDS